MSESNFLISVVIPTRHRNDLLKICLDQLAPGAQTLPAEQYEVIVTDDGSQSTAEAFLKEHYPWVRWVEGPRKGPGANRNFGAEQAQGEWIAFTDDDCIPRPGWLEAYVRALKPAILVYEGQTVCEQPYCPLTQETPVNTTGGNLWGCNFMIQRALFLELGGFDTSFPFAANEDTDFRERLHCQKILFPFVPEAQVAHPPRQRRRGALRGQFHESQALLFYKAGNRGFFTPRLMKQILATWYCQYQRWGRLSREVFSSLVSLAQELTYVGLHAPRWSHKYYLKYKDQPPSYHYCEL